MSDVHAGIAKQLREQGLVQVSEASEITGVSRHTIGTWMDRDRIKRIVVASRAYVSLADVQRMADGLDDSRRRTKHLRKDTENSPADDGASVVGLLAPEPGDDGWSPCLLVRREHLRALYAEPLALAVYLVILDRQSQHERTVSARGSAVTLSPGESIVGRVELSKLGIGSEGEVRSALALLDRLGIIETRGHTFGTVARAPRATYPEANPELQAVGLSKADVKDALRDVMRECGLVDK